MNQDIQTAQAALTHRVMALPGVIGTSISEFEGQPCIKVMVIHRTAQLEAEIPSTFEGHRVVLAKTGQIHARPELPDSDQ